MATAEATIQTGATADDHTGLWSWITTVDHKRIGILYAVTALCWLFVGGFEALLIRVQLMKPENDFLSADLYNQIFTMHGTTMIFLVGMPIAVALFNYLIPLQIGARDVAFPRLNALSYWIYLFGGIFLNVSFLFDAAPNMGWFGYAPLTSETYTPGLNADFWSVGIQILGIASIMGGVNFITTVINLRAPGMKLMRMPLFTWMGFVTSFLIVTALPVFAVALFFLSFDRFYGTNFYNVAAGGDPVLWQHLFWIFGHPEVYILILPAFGIISDVLPAHTRKPLFGYNLVVYSGILIGFIGWGVWAHHMFAVGMGPIADSFFAASTLIIAIPTGVKIFNWLATMWGGTIRFTTAMLFCIAFVAMFTIGGISGVHHGSPPADLHQTDTYYVVAHFHYVLVGGLVMGLFAGFYHWFPKVTGRFLDERIGKLNFWLLVIGVNLTFFPMHFAGLFGMPRRIFTYSSELNLGTLNLVISIGGFLTGIGALVFAWNVIRSLKKGEPAGNNPWDAHTLEWATTSPPQEYNFAELPDVKTREPLWDGVSAVDVAENPKHPIHLPSPSFWPIVTAAGINVSLILMMTELWWPPVLGAIFVALCIMNWAFEPLFKH
ncbi:MAG TPA: cytochrome c oxidase subunit I [Longimicrobiales bacterium]